MEESKEIQSIYSIFRVVIYVSLVVEFFEYACNPELLDTFAGVLTDLHERMGRWLIYQPGHLAYSKIATLLLVIITCIGTRNKKQIEFDARKMVFWPIVIGFVLVLLAVWLYYTDWLHYRLWIFPLRFKRRDASVGLRQSGSEFQTWIRQFSGHPLPRN